jgi:hypothetical protein
MLESVRGARGGGRHLLEPGPPSAGITRMALGRQRGTDATGGRLGEDAGLAPTRGRAGPLPLHDGRHGQSTGLHARPMPQGLAVGARCGRRAEWAVVTHRPCALLGEPCTLRRTASGRLRQAFWGLVAPGVERVPQCQALVCGVAHAGDTNGAWAATTAAKAAHDACARVAQDVHWA